MIFWKNAQALNKATQGGFFFQKQLKPMGYYSGEKSSYVIEMCTLRFYTVRTYYQFSAVSVVSVGSVVSVRQKSVSVVH